MSLPDPRASRAVLIGVSRYRYLSSFPSVANNVQTLCELLTSERGWRLPAANCVTVLDPPSVSAVMNVVHDVARQAESALLIYFAGHGLLDENGELHLALSGSDRDRMHDAVPFSMIRREVVLTAGRCRAKVVLIDSCYSGAAMVGFMGASPSVADLAVTDGAYIMTASGEGAAARAPAGARYTAFTGALVKAVQRGVPGGPALLDMDTLYDQVMLDLRAQNLPLPQRRIRNDGHRIALAYNNAAHTKAAQAKAAQAKVTQTKAAQAKVTQAKAAQVKVTQTKAAQTKLPQTKAAKAGPTTGGPNSVAQQPAGKRKQAPAAPAPADSRVAAADLAAIRHALRAAAAGQPVLPMSKAGEVIKEVCPHITATNWAGARSLSRFVDAHLPDLRPLAHDPEGHLRVAAGAAPAPRVPTPAKPKKTAVPAPQPRRRASARAGRRDIDRARTAIRAALREQPLLPVETAAAVLIKEVPAVFESSWAGAGTCKLFLAKYLSDFPFTENRTGGFIEAPPRFPVNVLRGLRRRLTGRRIRRLAVASVILVALGYAGDSVWAVLDKPAAADPSLKITSPAEGRLTRERYTVKVSRVAPAGQQIVAMVREAAPSNAAAWTFYRCAAAHGATECANVPIGRKGSGKRMQVAILVVGQAQGQRLLAPPTVAFRGAPVDVTPTAYSRTYQYQR